MNFIKVYKWNIKSSPYHTQDNHMTFGVNLQYCRVFRKCIDNVSTVFALIITHALINVHPLVCKSKMAIFGNFKASNKGHLQKIGEKMFLPYSVIIRTCFLIAKHTGPFLSGCLYKMVNTGNRTVTMMIFSFFCSQWSLMIRVQVYTGTF